MGDLGVGTESGEITALSLVSALIVVSTLI